MTSTKHLYTAKESGYYKAARLDLLEMLSPSTDSRLLEVGAGDGATLQEAKRKGLASFVAGIDLREPTRQNGNLSEVDLFLTGDFESMDLTPLGGEFDTIICADIIEHFTNPWESVRRLSGLLRPGGVLLSSIPNFRNHRVLSSVVLRGDFRYEEAGILDKSHLRFFCRENIRQLFVQADLVVESIDSNMGAYGLRHRFLDHLTFGLLHDFFIFQFRTRARKPIQGTNA